MPSSPSLTPDQLTQVRQNANWRRLFDALHISKDAKRSKDHDWWGKSPFRPEEATASFHMNARGWYCHSTGQGGGPIELVQRLHSGMNCYAAGHWLLERGLSRVVDATRTEVAAATKEADQAEEPFLENPPIRQDLRPFLRPGHPAWEGRGIPDRVLCDLGAGYLERPPRRGGRPDQMNRRLVFQIRGLRPSADGKHEPVILGHIGRATSDQLMKRDGKWWTYAGFRKSLELYNQDLALLDTEAREQAEKTGHLLLVEGCFDVAKLYAAGVRNVVATFGAQVSERQLQRLCLLTSELGVSRVRLFFDRDEAGEKGTSDALTALGGEGIQADSFDWRQAWTRGDRATVPIPTSIQDPADFSVGQLLWLRQEGLL